MDEQKRIYSLNKIAYLIAVGCSLQILFDEQQHLYGISNDEQLPIYLQQYRQDAVMHDYVAVYANLKKLIYQNRISN